MRDGAPIPHSKPSIGELEVEAAARVLLSGHLAQGEEVAAFEAEVAAVVGKRHGIAVASGTCALQLAAHALGAGSGDEVIVPSYVCTALLHAVRAAGATPIVCDIDSRTRNIEPSRVKRCLTPNSKAIVIPHMFGLTQDVKAFAALGLPIIEDCAMALGSHCGTVPAGAVGEVAVCSFYATKVISSGGEGGMVLTDDDGMAARLRGLREYDGLPANDVRYNCKMTELAATIGRVQLRQLPDFIQRRRNLASRYSRALEDSVQIPPAGAGHIYYRYVIDAGERTGSAVIAALEERGIQARRPVNSPLHRELGLDDAAYPETTRVHEADVSLPLYPTLDDRDANRVIEGVQQAAMLSRGAAT
jgi:dTDP-4-amino-4,6-dideoxygalactose transaminase